MISLHFNIAVLHNRNLTCQFPPEGLSSLWPCFVLTKDIELMIQRNHLPFVSFWKLTFTSGEVHSHGRRKVQGHLTLQPSNHVSIQSKLGIGALTTAHIWISLRLARFLKLFEKTHAGHPRSGCDVRTSYLGRLIYSASTARLDP